VIATVIASDRQLVGAAVQGSRAALELLVRRHHSQLLAVCRRRTRDRDLAADVSQRALLRALVKLATLRQPELFRSWLFTTAINLGRNELRVRRRFLDDPGPPSSWEPAIPAEAPVSLEGAEEAAWLRREVARLPRQQRRVAELRLYEELPFTEIAQALGMSRTAAKTNYHYAVKRLMGLKAPSPDGEQARRGR
jgi:RNA polymerase sigma-70 factor (ECF subfamily)